MILLVHYGRLSAAAASATAADDDAFADVAVAAAYASVVAVAYDVDVVVVAASAEHRSWCHWPTNAVARGRPSWAKPSIVDASIADADERHRSVPLSATCDADALTERWTW